MSKARLERLPPLPIYKLIQENTESQALALDQQEKLNLFEGKNVKMINGFLTIVGKCSGKNNRMAKTVLRCSQRRKRPLWPPSCSNLTTICL